MKINHASVGAARRGYIYNVPGPVGIIISTTRQRVFPLGYRSNTTIIIIKWWTDELAVVVTHDRSIYGNRFNTRPLYIYIFRVNVILRFAFRFARPGQLKYIPVFMFHELVRIRSKHLLFISSVTQNSRFRALSVETSLKYSFLFSFLIFVTKNYYLKFKYRDSCCRIFKIYTRINFTFYRKTHVRKKRSGSIVPLKSSMNPSIRVER